MFYKKIGKRVLDLLIVFPALIILLPFFFFISLLILVSSPGPILYRRHVVGIDGEQFDAFKFRTMITDADEVLKQSPGLWNEYQKNIKLVNDPRVTKVGKWLRRFSLDELPQLFNVVLGEMSLVGPRMITLEELPRYGKFCDKRLSVRPGMTGLWQINGRSALSYDIRIKLDETYIDELNLYLDLKILLKTPKVVLVGEGAL